MADMKEQLIQVLEITPAYYEEIVLKTYVDWCMLHNTAPQALQEALMSKALQNYFVNHYEVLERQFLQQVRAYVHLPARDKNAFYAEVTNTILNTYPGALLPKIKKRQMTTLNLN